MLYLLSTCNFTGRAGQIRVDDVVPPEVYVSGLGVLDPKMQSIVVVGWLQLIELEADVCCSYRLGAGSEVTDTGFKRAMFGHVRADIAVRRKSTTCT